MTVRIRSQNIIILKFSPKGAPNGFFEPLLLPCKARVEREMSDGTTDIQEFEDDDLTDKLQACADEFYGQCSALYVAGDHAWRPDNHYWGDNYQKCSGCGFRRKDPRS